MLQCYKCCTNEDKYYNYLVKKLVKKLNKLTHQSAGLKSLKWH